jgi:hypothetical protein
MPTGPANPTYVIPPLTLADTFYEWYKLTNDEIIDKLNRIKVYDIQGATGVGVYTDSSGLATAFLEYIVPGDHIFTGNITFDGTVTTVNSNLMTIDDYNLVLGAVGSSGGTGGTADAVITNAGGGGLVIAGACGDKYFLWKSFDGGRTYTAWRISDSLAFAGDATLYSGNNKFSLSEGSDSTPASKVIITTPSTGITVETSTYFDSPGITYSNLQYLSDGSTRVVNGSILKRFTTPAGGITGIGLTFGMVVKHDVPTNGVTLARANSAVNAESFGIVVNYSTTQNFVDVNTLGYVTGNFTDAIASTDSMTALGTGEFYFLSDSEAGKITKTAPVVTGNIRKPILYALGSTAAMVMNYVGAKVVDYDALYSKLNASTLIISHDPNQFLVGDVVRFEEGITSANRPFGSYVKAQCTSAEDAEALGIISRINYAGNSASSLVVLSGFVDLSASGSTYSPGQVYFLSEEPGKLSLSTPTSVLSVRKPMMVALSPTTGLVQNYVGLVLEGAGSGTSINLVPSVTGFKNRLINGNFDIWQRGTTFSYRNPTTEPDRYCADRWKLINSGGTTAERLNVTVNRIPLGLGDLPNTSTYSKYGLEFDIGTGGYTAGSQTYLYQRVEGIENLSRGFATISFYARATVSNAKMAVSFRRDFGGGTAPDYVATGVEKNSQKDDGFAISLPTEWTKFVYSFNMPDSAGGVVGASGNDGPEIRFFIRGGTDLVEEDISEYINPNLSGVNNYKIQIAQVQLEAGSEPTPFEYRDLQTEMSRCMRYYQTSNVTTPFRAITDGEVLGGGVDAIILEKDIRWLTVRYPVEIRRLSDSTLTIKTESDVHTNLLNTGSLAKNSRGFRVQKPVTSTVSDIYAYYEIESEL